MTGHLITLMTLSQCFIWSAVTLTDTNVQSNAVPSSLCVKSAVEFMLHFCLSPLFPGFNSNINVPGREDQGPTSLSPQLQDKNANTHNHCPNSPSPAPVENGNQLSNGNLRLRPAMR